jgi:L-ribulose-5-phosphate 4-epimerase
MEKNINFMKNSNYLLNQVVTLNKNLHKFNLTFLNFGNASAIDRKNKLIYIKGSGFETANLKSNQIATLKYNEKNLFFNKSKIKPSVDTKTHFYLYRQIKEISFIVHTHSLFATTMAQSHIEPHCTGTTHADFFYNTIPLSLPIKRPTIHNYEIEVGKSIIGRLKKEKFLPPGILLRDHGIVAWGKSAKNAINNLIAIEKICQIYYYSQALKFKKPLPKALHSLHFYRKNGYNNFYGQ